MFGWSERSTGQICGCDGQTSPVDDLLSVVGVGDEISWVCQVMPLGKFFDGLLSSAAEIVKSCRLGNFSTVCCPPLVLGADHQNPCLTDGGEKSSLFLRHREQSVFFLRGQIRFCPSAQVSIFVCFCVHLNVMTCVHVNMMTFFSIGIHEKSLSWESHSKLLHQSTRSPDTCTVFDTLSPKTVQDSQSDQTSCMMLQQNRAPSAATRLPGTYRSRVSDMWSAICLRCSSRALRRDHYPTSCAIRRT